MDTVRILVVCLGNICRSPAGEAALREAAKEAGVALEVESAGLGSWHIGQQPDRQVRAAGQRAGLVIDGTGRQITSPTELDDYDLILAMDRSNLAGLRELAPDHTDRMYLYRWFDPDADHDEMPDPYGRDDPVFDETIRLVRSGAAGIVTAIQSGRIP